MDCSEAGACQLGLKFRAWGCVRADFSRPIQRLLEKVREGLVRMHSQVFHFQNFNLLAATIAVSHIKTLSS